MLIYKLITFLYGIMKPFEFKIKNAIPFTTAKDKIEMLYINIMKQDIC